MDNVLLTIVGYIDNDELLENFGQSLENQELNKKSIEIILVDSVCSDISRQFVKSLREKGYNITHSEKKGITEEDAYAAFYGEFNGKFVNFTRTSAVFEAMSIYPSLFNKERLISFKPIFVNSNGKTSKYRAAPTNGNAGTVVLEEKQSAFQLHLGAYFIPNKFLSEVSFDLSLHSEAMYKLLIDLLEIHGKYKYFTYRYRYTHAAEDVVGVAEIQYNKWWYTDSLKNFLIPTVKNTDKEYIKNACLYLLLSKYNCNLFNRNKKVLNEQEVKEFNDLTGEFLSYVPDNETILGTKRARYVMARSFRIFLTKLKYKYEKADLVSALDDEDNFYYSVQKNGTEISKIPISLSYREKIGIDVINYYDGKISIDGTFSPAVFLNDDEFIAYAEFDEKKYPLIRNEIYPENYCFGVSFFTKYRFTISLPADKVGRIKFYYEYKGKKIPLKINSSGPFCHLNCRRNSYWHFSDKTLYFRQHRTSGDTIHIKKNNPFVNFFKEIYITGRNLIEKKFTKKSILASGFRVVYWLTRPFFCKKHIWLYFDKLYKAGDNAEYLFHYAMSKNDGISNYYIVNKDSPDYERLIKTDRKHILVFNSIRAKLYALNAECVLATHANVMGFLGFPRKVHQFFTNLYKLRVVCVQHGLTIQQIAVHQNRLVDDTRLYCCASKFEIDNLEQPVYGYYDDELKLVGLARYDGLKSNDKRQILITPTWRKECARGDSQMGSARKYNELFKTTEYFRLYNTLINDKRLINSAKEYGYRIIYLLHPVVSSQKEDFKTNDYVEILAAAGDMSYEKILTESSLMVTDYSGVQFDFAYQRKPIVYYHPSTLPPHYDEGCGFIYEDMGFGPIITEHEQLVDELCEYMKNECKIKPEYVKRADNFFAFDDFNNCQRIYDEVLRYIKK